MSSLESLHPAVRTWFERRFGRGGPGQPDRGPTEPQAGGWPEIAAGRDTLIAAPTGTGKTLAAFLVCHGSAASATPNAVRFPTGTDVVYVSPLKALAVDVRENLLGPLAEIRALSA